MAKVTTEQRRRYRETARRNLRAELLSIYGGCERCGQNHPAALRFRSDSPTRANFSTAGRLGDLVRAARADKGAVSCLCLNCVAIITHEVP